ncbi:MAG: NAD-dependent dehydratase [Sphingopyxis sp.]|uniref:NAD-dependent epimerase/dehydratase family protein n=1 Tax=Sphingopyxis sp. TaxID=1908224 RepID=UPI001A50DEB3|nr:NAD-dependent epimerase/dehydratase family protein [Sphingopyxis sp.]MBL9071455.1 NAD-dependent dehydratase [Sphingopyxis sp.]
MSDTLIVGASGLVGRLVIDHAAGPLTVIARREIADLPRQHRLIVAPPERWAEIIAAERPATLISCLGTTIRQAGSQAAFRAVDRDLVLAVAEAAKRGGATHVISVSSVGATARMGNFYLRTKGEAEDGLCALGFDRVDLLRPGLLKGERAGPPRLGEGLAMVAAPFADALLHGSLRRYRSIAGNTVAKAIAALIGNEASGVHIHENDAIRALAD